MRSVERTASRCREESGGEVSENACVTIGAGAIAGAVVMTSTGAARTASADVGAVLSLSDGDS